MTAAPAAIAGVLPIHLLQDTHRLAQQILATCGDRQLAASLLLWVDALEDVLELGVNGNLELGQLRTNAVRQAVQDIRQDVIGSCMAICEQEGLSGISPNVASTPGSHKRDATGLSTFFDESKRLLNCPIRR